MLEECFAPLVRVDATKIEHERRGDAMVFEPDPGGRTCRLESGADDAERGKRARSAPLDQRLLLWGQEDEACGEIEKALEHVDADQGILFCSGHEDRPFRDGRQTEVHLRVAERPEQN